MVFGESTQTTSDWVRETRSYTQGSSKEQANVLDADFNPGDEQMVMKFPVDGTQVGQTLEVGWLLYQVVDVDTSSRTLSVVPEIEDAEHLTGERVRMRPNYSTRRVIEQLNNDLRDLSAQNIYRLETVEAIDGAADVPLGALVVLDAWSKEPGLNSRQLPSAFYQLADTPEGKQLRGPATLEYVTYGCIFNPLPFDEDVVITDHTGLWASALDIPPMGAAITLLSGSESQRNIITHQGDTRRAGEVPPGSITGALQTLAALRSRRIVAEGQRLTGRYGHTIDVGVF